MNKRILAFLLALAMSLSCLPAHAQAAETASISLSSGSCRQGEQTYIEVTGNNLEDVASLDFEIYYDADALQINGTGNGWLLGNAMVSVNIDTPGVIKFSMATTEGITGSGMLLGFWVATNEDTPAGSYNLQCAVGDAYSTGLSELTIRGGSTQITVEPRSLYPDDFWMWFNTPEGTFSKGDSVELRLGHHGDSLFSSADFLVEYDPQLLELDTVALSQELTVEGAVYSINTATEGAIRISYASTNQIQAWELINMEFHVIADVDARASISVTASDLYRQDLSTYPQTTQSWYYNLVKQPEATEYPAMWLEMPTNLTVGGSFTTDLMLEKDSAVAAGDFTLNYDSSVLKCVSVSTADGLGSLGGMVVVNPKYSNGTIKFSYVNEQAYCEEDFALVTIEWKLLVKPKKHISITSSGTGVCGKDYKDISLSYTTNTCCIHTAAVTAPTCTEKGYTAYRCIICGNQTKDTYVDPLGHTEVIDPEKAPTCIKSGLTEGKHCSVCNTVIIAQETVAPTGHSHIPTVTPPTCEDRGYTTYLCHCGDSYVGEYVNSLGHTEVTDPAKDPTCTEPGLKQGIHCSVCGKVLLTQSVIPATGHSHEAVVTHPTCTQQGYTTHTCHCGAVYIDSYMDPVPHDGGTATCTKYAVCIWCGIEYGQLDFQNHTGQLELREAVDATCTTDGSTGDTYCLDCGKIAIPGQVIPASHQYTTTVFPATYTQDGYTQYMCTVCAYSYQDHFITAFGLPSPVVTVVSDPISGGGILTWEHDGEADVYEVYRATSKTGKYTLVDTVSNAEAQVAIPAGKTYYFKVKAICQADAALNSGYSAIVSLTGKCAQPEITAEANASTGKPVISWAKISGAAKYTVYRATEENGTYATLKTTTSTSYTDTTATVGKTYYYKVKAIASSTKNNSIESEVQSCLAVCAQPVVTIKVDTVSGKPIISWKTITGAQSYLVLCRYPGDELFTPVTDVAGLSYTDLTAPVDADLEYAVIAQNAAEEANSAQSAVKSIHSTLAQPVMTTEVDTITGKPVMEWAEVEGAISYTVYRSTSATKSYKAVYTGAETEYTDTSVAGGKSYYYKVMANGENANSAYSAYVKLTGKCAQPVVTVAANTSTGKPVISWAKVSGAAKYTVYRATEENGTYATLKTTTSTSYTDTTAVVGKTYYYKVKAIASSTKNNSIESDVQSCLAVCAQPVVSVKVDTVSGKPVISWKTITGAQSYLVLCRYPGDELFTPVTDVAGLSYTDLTAPVDADLEYAVIAQNAAEEANSVQSAVKSIHSTLAQPVMTTEVDTITGKPVMEWAEVDGAISYTVYRSTSATKSYKAVYTGAETEYTDTSVAGGKSYYYKVMANGENANSAYSAYVKLTGKCAQPVVTVAANTSTGKPVVSWAKISGAAKYTVYRATEENGTYATLKTTTSTSYTDTTAVVGKTYYYKVKAIASSTKNNSIESDVQSCLAVCAQPVVTVKVDTASGKPVISWKTIPSAVSYAIYRGENGEYVKLAEQTALSYTDGTAAAGVEYSYYVVAVAADSASNSAPSVAKSVYANCAKAVISIQLDGNKPMVSWEEVEGATSYVVYRSTKSTSGYKAIGTVTDGLSYTDSSAKKGTTYYYKVAAATETTTGAQSAYAKIKSQ